MTLQINTLTVDCHDQDEQERFWAEALGCEVVLDPDGDPRIVPTSDRAAFPPGAFPILFLGVPPKKTTKNRVHLDLAPDGQAAEVARLWLGATRIDIGQEDGSWVVMADPEGNFCVLESLPS